MNPLVAMLTVLRDADHARCRVTRWKLTEAQAMELAFYLGDTSERSRAPSQIFKSMKSGACQLLGAPVVVLQ